jgi:putative copper resistance protein D
VLAGIAGLGAGTAAAHGAFQARPDWTTAFTAWEFDPLFIVPLVAVAWAYGAAVRKVNREHPASPFPAIRVGYFAAGLAALVLALMSPIAAYDTTLFSVHMIQHMLITAVAAPLLLLGAPVTLALRAASPQVRKEVLLPVLHSRLVRAVSFPVVAWLLFTGVMWISHYSPLFDAALENAWLHRLEHALYLGSALLFWWPAVGLDLSPWRLNHPLRLLYVFLQMPQQAFLGTAIYNAGTVIFPHYASLQRDWGPTPLRDQQYAGIIMWVVGDVLFLIALACIAYGWVKYEERSAKRGDAARARSRARAAAAAAASDSHGG